MEYRYLVAGINITLISVIFIVFALLSNNNVVLGISISTLVLGALLLTIGMTYTPPLRDLLRIYVSDANLFINKIFEDSGLITNHKFKICLDRDKALAIFSNKNIDCKNITPGLGVIDDVIYISIPIKSLITQTASELTTESGTELLDYLREVLVSRYGICRDIIVREENSEINIELISITKEAKSLMNTPINPIRIAIPTIISRFLNRSIEVIHEELVGDNYIIKIKRG